MAGLAWTPPASDQIVQQSAADTLNRPVIVPNPKPVSPTFIPGTHQTFDPKTGAAQDIPNVKPEPPADKTSYRDMTTAEKVAHHLSPEAPWLVGSNGDFKLPDGYKPADDASKDAIQKQENLDAADSLINGVRRARGFIGDAIDIPLLGNTATGGGYNVLRHSPFPTDASKLEGVISQEIRGNIFMKRIADLKAASDSPTGGTGIGRIMQAEIPLITGAIGTLDPGKLGKDETLKSLDQIERAALRSKAIFNGENPDDPAVQHKYGITALGATSSGSPPSAGGNNGGGTTPAAPTGGGITGSNALPTDNIAPPALVAAAGGTQAIVNPKVAAIAPQLTQYLNADQKKISNAMIVGFVKKSGIDPSQWPELKDALSKRGKVQFVVDPHFTQPMSEDEQRRNEGAQSTGAALVGSAVNGATAGNYGRIAGALGGDQNKVEQALAVGAQNHPTASLAGALAGGGAAAMGIDAALAGTGMAPTALRNVLADSTYGAATNPGNPLKGAALGAGGSLAGRGLGHTLGAIVGGVTNPITGYVAREAPGAMTIGQAVGQSGRIGAAVKGVEDRLSGIPIVGDAINARRLEGLQKMNSAAFDKALEPIGEKAGGRFGDQAVAHAQDQVSHAFTAALGGKTAGIDHGFIADATKAKMGVDNLPDSVRGEVNNQIDHVVNNYFDDGGQITGENMQALLQDLGGIKRGYQGTPLGHRIGGVVDQFSDSVENLFRRQAPDVMPQYDAAKKAFRRVSVLEDAVNKAKNMTDGKGQVFTPAQLGLVDRANSIKYDGKGAAAAGKSTFHDFHKNMQAVLPNKVPDSGTAGRLFVPAAILGAGAGAGAETGNTEKGLTLGALLALAYSRTGQHILTAGVLNRPAVARAAGQVVRKSAPLLGHGSAAATSLGSPRE
jgi:hypothetical protein